MRILEILIAGALGVYLIAPLLSKGKPRPTWLSGLGISTWLLVILHWLLEGYRWQMFPLYAIALIVGVGIAAGRKLSISTMARIGLSVLGLLGFALACLLPALLPVPKVPPPSGKYPVGTITYVLVDDSRREIYSGKDEARKFMVQIWYPADPSPSDEHAPWMPDAELVAPAIATYLGLPSFFLDHLILAKTDSYLQPAIAKEDAPYPIVLFSHGWNGFRAQNTFQTQELASHGYVVVGMEHTYGARLTVFPDGQIAPNNPDALPRGLPEQEYDAAARMLVAQWAEDMGYALDFLSDLTQNDPQGRFTGALDLQKVGVMGHSTGGGATIQFCGTDSRCQAGFPMDAFMTPVSEEVLDAGAPQPFMFMFSETFSGEKNQRLFKRFYSHIDASSPVITIMGAAHFDFSDLPALSPLAPMLGLKGPINGERVQSIINTYTLAFFDWTLKGIPTTLLEGPQEAYPELIYGLK